MAFVGPSHLGRYAVRRRLGSGGFATVWLAYDEQLDAPVAIKVLAENWAEQHEVRTRFLEEGRYLRRVESPHVVPVYDAGQLEDGRPYLVMAYADQGTLADRLEQLTAPDPAADPAAGPAGLHPAQAALIVQQVAAGLGALHDRGILHRDVKPANVLFRTVDLPGASAGAGGAGAEPRVRAMVGDLGLGKALDVSSRLTMIAGTPAFVSPEQARGEGLDARADQYSLAVLAFLLLSGRLPWTHATLPAAAEPGEPVTLSTSERRFPAEVEDVVRRGLARDRTARFDTVSGFADALTAALAPLVGDTAPTTVTMRPLEVTPSGAPALPRDPDLTQPGVRPSPAPADPPAGSGAGSPAGPGAVAALASSATRMDPAEPPTSVGADLPAPPPAPGAAPRGRGRAVLATLAVAVATAGLGVAAGAGVGVATASGAPETREVSDDSGAFVAVVPGDWDAEADGGWVPPSDAEPAGDTAFPALSVGNGPDWPQATDGEGLFVGLIPSATLPDVLPGHPDCASARGVTGDRTPDGVQRTQVFEQCADGDGVVVERVVQVADEQIVWIQVRAARIADATAVLDSLQLRDL
ncbi:serine/threonine-protein kinase [Nocardioides sp.]|uniref:serine/threonine-protein kinase n=1 Tax=Nocardioides sp. TaxID=35761 RepID=UPI003519366A